MWVREMFLPHIASHGKLVSMVELCSSAAHSHGSLSSMYPCEMQGTSILFDGAFPHVILIFFLGDLLLQTYRRFWPLRSLCLNQYRCCRSFGIRDQSVCLREDHVARSTLNLLPVDSGCRLASNGILYFDLWI
uniref:Uncharacterized protein n=1 Tax=Cacopsylla melanoneura TaxID=428564 RepID=A0A8D8R0E1_9HEMI